MNRLPAAALAAALLLPSLAACDAGGGPAPAAIDDSATFRVERRDLRVTITEKGNLKTANQVLVRPAIPGSAKIVSLVDEGTQVKAGDVVCELDSTETLKQAQDLENRVIALRGEVAAAEAELAIQLSQNDSDVRDAELKYRFAQVELERWEKGEFVQETSKRKIRVTEAVSDLARAKDKYEQMPALEKEGFVTKDQVEEERIRMVKAESELHLARLDLETYEKYTAPKELEQRQADERNAGLQVERAKQRAAAREAQRRSAVERQKSELVNTTRRLEEAKTTLENMTIRAPAPGLVIYGDARNPWEDRQVKVGESVYAGQALLTLPDLNEMLVVVAIHEADIARLRVGQRAFVNVETAREQTLEGKVVRIAPVAAQQNQRWSDGIKRFNVEVQLDENTQGIKLKPGLSGKVEILVDEVKGVLAVPQQAVFSQRGRFHAFRREGDRAVRVPVEIEPGNSQYVVVKSGLSESDSVLLYDPEAGGGSSVAGGAEGDAPDASRNGAPKGAPPEGARGGGKAPGRAPGKP
jgi:HlyD family secretion protein